MAFGAAPWVSACVTAGTAAVAPVVAVRLSTPAVIAERRLGLGLKETSFSTGLGAYVGLTGLAQCTSGSGSHVQGRIVRPRLGVTG